MKLEITEAEKDFYTKTFRVNVALQTALYLLDDLSDNYLYKQRVKQLIERFKTASKQEIDRIVGTLTTSETDNYAKLSFDKYEEFKNIILKFENQ